MLLALGRKQFNVLMKSVVENFIAKKKEMNRYLRANHLIIQNPWSRPPILVKLKVIKQLKAVKKLKELRRFPNSPATESPRKANLTVPCPTVTRLMTTSVVGLNTYAKLPPACETHQRIRTDHLSTATESAILRIKPRH